MNPYERRFRDFMDDDPIYEYHQDYREGITARFKSAGFVLPILLCSLPIIYQLLYILDYNILSLPDYLWNIFVYLTPSRLLDAVESFQNPLRVSNPAPRAALRTHAAKCEAMRRILGLDRHGIMETVAQAGKRRLSTITGISIASAGKVERPAGLGNYDNSCYQNSVLQGLASLDSLPAYLPDSNIESEELDESEKPEMKMAEALRGLIERLKDPSNNGERIWTPAVLKNMSSWQQQDAQEYFSKVLDEIDKEMATVAKNHRLLQGFESNDSSSSNSEASSQEAFRNPLEGLIAQRVGCTECKYTDGLTLIPFNCLTVPLGRAWEHHLYECLDEYTKLESITGVECGKCTLTKLQRLLHTLIGRLKDKPEHEASFLKSKIKLANIEAALEDDDYEEKTLLHKCDIQPKSRVSTTKTRTAVIARPPKSLVVHFNRSLFDENTGDLRKNISEVRFPRVLDLGPWCLGSVETEDNNAEEWRLNPESPMIAGSRRPSKLKGPYYQLRAVVTHQGRHENGHYVCYRKHPAPASEDGESKTFWWRLSDDDVMKVPEATVLNQGGVFMLFYDLIGSASTSSSSGARAVIATDGAADVKKPMSTSHSVTEYLNSIPLSPETKPLPELAIAASIPLPAISDDDLSALEDSTRYQDSVATADNPGLTRSLSEPDEDELDEVHEGYRPVKPLFVQPYLPETGMDANREGVDSKQTLSPGSLLMV